MDSIASFDGYEEAWGCGTTTGAARGLRRAGGPHVVSQGPVPNVDHALAQETPHGIDGLHGADEGILNRAILFRAQRSHRCAAPTSFPARGGAD